jgi:hypothetical protein
VAVKNANVRAGHREQGHEADKMQVHAKAIRAKHAKENSQDKALDRPAPLLLMAKSGHGRDKSKPSLAHTNYTP